MNAEIKNHPLSPVTRIQKKFQQRREFAAVGIPARKLKKRMARLDREKTTAIQKLTHPNTKFKLIGNILVTVTTPKPVVNGCYTNSRNAWGHVSQYMARVGKRVRVGPRQKLEKLPKLTPEQVNRLETTIEQEIKGVTGSLTVEGSAIRHNAHPTHIQEVFRRLNRKGLLSQKRRAFAHDTVRNPMFCGSDSGWAANYYNIQTPQ